jgi:hypothetical protein
MRLAEEAAMAELGPARPLLQRVPIEIDRGGPVPLPFQIQGALKDQFGVVRV